MHDDPTIGRIVWYRTDGRNGLIYDLPAIVTCTHWTHPGSYYPAGRANPLPVPEEGHVHLTVFTPGGFGSTVIVDEDDDDSAIPNARSDQFPGAERLDPGSGTYVELNVPHVAINQPADVDLDGHDRIPHRSWRWPTRA